MGDLKTRLIQWWLVSILCVWASVNAGSAASLFNIMDYGARNDGSAPATSAIRSAIEAAKKAGGGTIYIPPGKYVTGPIELVSNLVLDIDAGAVLEFEELRNSLTYAKGRLEGTECITPVPLLGGHDLENVTIQGRGVITTNNAEWLALDKPEAEARDVCRRILQSLNEKKAVPEEDFRKAAMAHRPSFIGAMNSKNILIDGIRIVGSPFWTIHILYSEKVAIRNVTIETFPGTNTDGIDIDSSSDVRISDCFLDTGDDAICLKSGKDADGLRVNRPTENIAITNCTVRHGHGAVALGSETSGGIRNVVVRNIVCLGTQKGVRIKSTRGRGGILENIRFDNWTMRNVEEAINITNYYTQTPEESVSERTPVFRHITVSNMTIEGSAAAVNIEGLPEMPISDLHISNVSATARTGLRAYNTSGLELHQVQVNAGSGPAFLIRDSRDLELDAVSTPQPLADTPVIRLDHCPGAIVRASKAFPGPGTFLSVAPAELQDTIFEGNFVNLARQATEECAGDFWRLPSD